MGWKGYRTEIPAGMLFRKMHCCACGSRLKRHKISRVFKKGEDGYENRICMFQTTLGMDRIERGYFIYKCPDCGRMTTYEKQLEISKIQKRLEKKVLQDDERPTTPFLEHAVLTPSMLE